MKTYDIAGIKIGIGYLYDTYLKNNIEIYEKKDIMVDHVMTVQMVHGISYPNGKPQHQKNPYIIIENNQTIIFIKNKDNNVQLKITHDDEYHHVLIELDPDLITHPDEYEYTWLGLMFMEIALRYQKLPLHASAIDDHGQAVLISAPSQTGKSTLAKHWKEIDSEISIMNDDKPLIGFYDDVLSVFSSPFSGKSANNENKIIPLKAIIFLYQGQENKAVDLDEMDVITEFMKNMMRPRNEKTWDDMIELINHIIYQVPIKKYLATNHPSAASYLRDIINQGETT